MRKTLMAASVLALVAGSASAATVSYSGSTGVVSTLGTVTLQQFDSSLGTLTGIQIDWDSGFSARFVAAQETPSSAGTVSGADGFVVSTIINISSPAGTSVPNLSSTAGSAFAASVPPTYQQIVSGGDSDVRNYGPLASFIGVGTVSYNFFGSSSDTSSASNGILRGVQDYLYIVNADVTYTYSPSTVPVPAALPLLATAFGALGVMRLRRKA